jgi:hypothetical protein
MSPLEKVFKRLGLETAYIYCPYIPLIDLSKPMNIDTTQRDAPMNHDKIKRLIDDLSEYAPFTVSELIKELRYEAPEPEIYLSDLKAGDKFKMYDSHLQTDEGYVKLKTNGLVTTAYVYLWEKRHVLGGTDVNMRVIKL